VSDLSEDQVKNEPPERNFGGGLTVRGYMCLIDWECEIGHNPHGNKVYPSLHALQGDHTMWKDCGVVEVEVRAVRLVAPAILACSAAKL
jgi:hypothetical protein